MLLMCLLVDLCVFSFLRYVYFFFFFFFQAEDGIRDHCVTGVQTCALPIYVRLKRGADREAVRLRIAALLPPGVHVAPVQALEQASSYPSRAYRVNLDVLAMVALFTGGFLV